MKKIVLFSTLALALAVPTLRADEAVRAAQTALQSAGFYTGAADGELNADTQAALRRYQIRHQLEPSGALTPETVAALNQESGNAPAVPAMAPAPAPVPAAPTPVVSSPAPLPPDPAYLVLFARGPYENAAPEVQAATVRKAQALLAERRFYRGAVDGLPRPALEEALFHFQDSQGLPRTGRLDIDTLANLHLLPIAKLRHPRINPVPYEPRVPGGAVRGVPLD